MIYTYIIIIFIIFLFITFFQKKINDSINKEINSINDSIEQEIKETKSLQDGAFDIVSFDIRDYKKRADYKKFITEYFKKLTKNIDEAQTNIIVFDYLAHHNHIRSLREYIAEEELSYISILYTSYFTAIENALNRGVKYTRVIQLPLNSPINSSRECQIEFFLKKILKETYQHIEKVDKNPNFSFYILENAVRPYSFMIIDNDTLICEYDRYDKNRHPLPDVLFIDKATSDNPLSELKIFIKKQKYLIDRILDINKEAVGIPNPKQKIVFNDIKAIQKTLIEKEKKKKKEYQDLVNIIIKKEENKYEYLCEKYIQENLSKHKESLSFENELLNFFDKTNRHFFKEGNLLLTDFINLRIIKTYFTKKQIEHESNLKFIKELTPNS